MVKLKYCWSLVLLLLLSDVAMAQYKTPYSHYMLNKYELNPGYGGLDFSLSGTAVYRSQWQSVEGNPETIYLSAHMPFYIWNGAIGVQFDRRSLGAFSMSGVDLSYNYVMDNGYGLLSFGGRLGLTYMNIAGSKIRTPEGEYSVAIDHRDPILSIGNEGGIGPRFDIGVYFYSKKLEAGLDVRYLPPSDVYFSNFTIDHKYQMNAYFEYKTNITDEIKLNPSMLIYTDFQTTQTHLSALAELNGSIFGGIGFRGFSNRTIDAINMMIGTRFNKHYMISYNYDYGVSDIGLRSEGSHEIIFNYNLRRSIATGVPPKIIYNPKYL